MMSPQSAHDWKTAQMPMASPVGSSDAAYDIESDRVRLTCIIARVTSMVLQRKLEKLGQEKECLEVYRVCVALRRGSSRRVMHRLCRFREDD